MPVLSAVHFREIRLPLREPFRISSGVVSERRIALVEVRSEDGATGWGECVAGESPNYSAETIDTAWIAMREWMAPRLIGRPIDDPARVLPLLEEGIRGHPMAKAALEMAIWDLMARSAGVPLARLLGGTRESIEVGISLGIQDREEEIVARACAAVAEGYRRVKLKIRPGKDIGYVAAVREAVGPEVTLTVDANSAYSLEDADHLAQLDAFGLGMIEQPLRHDDLRRHALLQARLRTPLCIDESITGPDQAEDMIALGSGRIVNIKPGRVGGLTSSRAIHDLCSAAGIPVWCGGMLESGIGRGHNVALASLPNFTLPGDLSPSARYWEKDIVDREWTMTPDGRVDVPWDRPGIGVEPDPDRIDDLTVRRDSVEPGT